MFGLMRRVVTVLFVVGLAIGVVLLWPRSEPEEPSDTLAEATTTSTSVSGTTSTSDVPPTSSSSGEEGHVVGTVEEAEEILREMWFGWFEGIYNQDEDRIREVVASEQMLNAAQNAFGSAFLAMPTRDGVVLDLEILRSEESCLVTWGELEVTSFRGPVATTENVQVLRKVDGEWRFFSSWINKGDRWEADCEAELLPLP
jgi:hypothetical protein